MTEESEPSLISRDSDFHLTSTFQLIASTFAADKLPLDVLWQHENLARFTSVDGVWRSCGNGFLFGIAEAHFVRPPTITYVNAISPRCSRRYATLCQDADWKDCID
jgi:hypothetical protein